MGEPRTIEPAFAILKAATYAAGPVAPSEGAS